MRLGQHFLINDRILDKISSFIDENDIVLEIGSGYGNLTKYLLKAKKVYAVEIDSELFKSLKKIKVNNLIPINENFLDVEIPKDVTKIVGNIPYKISSKITEKVLRFLKKGQVAILMYQKEFARRLIAKPCESEYSRISVLTRYLSNAEIIQYVSKNNFKPKPRVDSAIVKIVSNGKRYDEGFFKFVKMLFTHKNKKVSNSLYDELGIRIKDDRRVRCLDINDMREIMKQIIFKYKVTY